MTPRQSQHVIRWQKWQVRFRGWLLEKRGRQTACAEFLGVRRQNVHRWFVEMHTKIPAWAAVTANVWFASLPKQLTLVPPQTDSPVVPPQADSPKAA